MQLQRILRFQKQHFAPRHTASRLLKPTKDNFSVGSSGYTALPKPAAFSLRHNGILAVGYKQSASVNRRINSSGMLIARTRVPATRADVFGYDQIRDGPLAALLVIKGLGTEHQPLPKRYQPQSVRGVQIPKSVGTETGRYLVKTTAAKHLKYPIQPSPIGEMANCPTATLRRFTFGSTPSFPSVGNAGASGLPRARYSFVDIGDQGSLGARPPPTEEQFGLDGFANQASQIGQESRRDTSGCRPQQRKASPSATTIHIDGSVLGRWAIQHLERTLGKPATGMTGVDPRANPPRSRVSPF
jgi:hypothetical protein